MGFGLVVLDGFRVLSGFGLGWMLVLGNASSQLEQVLLEESADKWPQIGVSTLP